MARKNKQQIDELRELADEDLLKEMGDAYKQLFTARLQLSTRQLANTSLPRKAKQRISRIKTIQRERELAALYEAAVEAES
jgi:ribosomal protein L29